MKIVILGIRCSGKGTSASRLSSMLGVPQISTGEIFRRNIEKETPLGKKVKKIYNSGGLVSDEITLELIKDRLKESDCKNGFILDGFPRTLNQAKALDEMENIDYAVFLDVCEDIVKKRVTSRIVCRNCGEVYNKEFIKPNQQGICNICGEELYQKDDDKPDAVKQRLEEDKKNLKPLIDYYKSKGILKVVKCEGIGVGPDIIVERIKDALKVE